MKLQRILSFDTLLGPPLVKLVYYVGMAGLVVFIAITLLAGVMSLVGGNFGGGAMQLLAAPAVGLALLVAWRFVCELCILAFLNYERLGEVRDLMRIAAGYDAPPAAPVDPNHPQF